MLCKHIFCKIAAQRLRIDVAEKEEVQWFARIVSGSDVFFRTMMHSEQLLIEKVAF